MEAQVNEEDKKMKVFVDVPAARYLLARRRRDPVALEVSGNDTVASVKATLHGSEGIPLSRQRLVFARSALPDDDDTTLGEHGVVDSSTIQLVETNMCVFVHCMHTRRSRTIALYGVESSDTVESFRIRLQELLVDDSPWLRPALQRIILGGAQLEDGHTLADYGVRDGWTAMLLSRVFKMRGRSLELEVEVTDTVGRIKERVEELEGVPVACQSASYLGKRLHDDRALADDHACALEYVYISCRRQEVGDATRTRNKEDTPRVNDETTELTAKRHADVDITRPGKKIKQRRKKKSLQAVRRRPFSVHLTGPELAAICPSSCDIDPSP